MKWLCRLMRSREGATAVEYAVMLALVILACIAGVMSLGQQTASTYQNSAASISTAMGS